MQTLAVVIIICVAVLSTPLTLKKLIDRSKNGKTGVPKKEDFRDWLDNDPLLEQKQDKDKK